MGARCTFALGPGWDPRTATALALGGLLLHGLLAVRALRVRMPVADLAAHGAVRALLHLRELCAAVVALATERAFGRLGVVQPAPGVLQDHVGLVDLVLELARVRLVVLVAVVEVDRQLFLEIAVEVGLRILIGLVLRVDAGLAGVDLAHAGHLVDVVAPEGLLPRVSLAAPTFPKGLALELKGVGLGPPAENDVGGAELLEK